MEGYTQPDGSWILSAPGDPRHHGLTFVSARHLRVHAQRWGFEPVSVLLERAAYRILESARVS